MEIPVNEVDGEAHDVEIRTADGGAADIAYPFLDTVGAGFVERPVAVYIIADLFVGQFFERHIRFINKGNNPTRPPLKGGDFLRKSDGGINLMGFAGQGTEHSECFCLVVRFAEHLTVRPNDGIRGNEELVFSQSGLIRARFRTRYIIRNIAGLEVRRIGLIRVDGDRRKGYIQACEQFAAARALRA